MSEKPGTRARQRTARPTCMRVWAVYWVLLGWPLAMELVRLRITQLLLHATPRQAWSLELQLVVLHFLRQLWHATLRRAPAWLFYLSIYLSIYLSALPNSLAKHLRKLRQQKDGWRPSLSSGDLLFVFPLVGYSAGRRSARSARGL